MQSTITALTENISLWQGVVTLKGHCIQAIYNNIFDREYFTLGWYCGLFKTTAPSQGEMFSVKPVILAWFYAVAFQDHSTLPKRKILCYCRLLICSGLSRPSKSEIIFSKSCYCRLLVCSTITENISLWEGVVTLKDQYI